MISNDLTLAVLVTLDNFPLSLISIYLPPDAGTVSKNENWNMLIGLNDELMETLPDITRMNLCFFFSRGGRYFPGAIQVFN